jgi:hypothetical protein
MDYEKLFTKIQEDYDLFLRHTAHHMGIDLETVKKSQRELGLCVKRGRKYDKICLHDGVEVWGFVKINDCEKFKRGDLLMAESWHKPALNKARGNVLSGDFSKVTWQGLQYLK